MRQDVPREDAISLRHLPRQSSKNCDLHFAKVHRLKTNYCVEERGCARRRLSTFKKKHHEGNGRSVIYGSHFLQNSNMKIIVKRDSSLCRLPDPQSRDTRVRIPFEVAPQLGHFR